MLVLQGEMRSWLCMDPWMNGVTSVSMSWRIVVELETSDKSVMDDSVLTIVSLLEVKPCSTGIVEAGWVWSTAPLRGG